MYDKISFSVKALSLTLFPMTVSAEQFEVAISFRV